MPISRNKFGSWAWLFAKTSLKQQNPSRKPRLSVTQPSRKPKPPVPTPYRRPKPFAPWPSGTQRPGEPPRLAHFNNCMLSPSSAWKNKLLRKGTRVSLTSSPPVKPPYKLPTKYRWDRCQCPFHLAFHKELPPLSKCLPPWLFHLLHLSLSPGLSGNIPLKTQWMSCLWVGPHPMQTWQDPLAPNSKR